MAGEGPAARCIQMCMHMCVRPFVHMRPAPLFAIPPKAHLELLHAGLLALLALHAQHDLLGGLGLQAATGCGACRRTPCVPSVGMQGISCRRACVARRRQTPHNEACKTSRPPPGHGSTAQQQASAAAASGKSCMALCMHACCRHALQRMPRPSVHAGMSAAPRSGCGVCRCAVRPRAASQYATSAPTVRAQEGCRTAPNPWSVLPRRL